MGKKGKVIYLSERITEDISDIKLLLKLIIDCKVETMNEMVALAYIALEKGKKVDRNNGKIGKILMK